MTVLTNRLNTESGCQLAREGGAMTDSEKEHYGASQMVRYVSGINRPIYPIAFIKYKTAIGISAAVCCFSPTGRKKIHDNLEMDTTLFAYLRENPPQGHSLEYADCRLSLLSAQKGKCSVSGELFLNPDNIVCHMLLFESIERRKPDSVAVRQYKVFKLAAGKTAKSSPPSRRRCPSDCSMPG